MKALTFALLIGRFESQLLKEKKAGPKSRQEGTAEEEVKRYIRSGR
ncbi:hypothetical protein NX786_11640 [Telluria mixta]|uniref:Uncharacterized protein n=1 Tax=Telluria mixta TaxID=34071 RepID=A0ABT2BXW1_9BURK|nr:hypothetical protein [Telluria mixta]MCS0629984.1 hypothetical protein [Telluria mixta]WEM96463.1 hypothetical protein P0M04_01560 [Telluria mixta]